MTHLRNIVKGLFKIIGNYLILTACVLGQVMFSESTYALHKFSDMSVIKINIKGDTISVWIPVNPAQYQRGLKLVTSEELKGKGMLFSYPKNHIPMFTMQGTLTDIDLICMDGEGIILEAFQMKQNDSKLYKPVVPCQFVLELLGGSYKKYQLNLGDKIDVHQRP